MRTELAKMQEVRDTFTGTFVRFGTKNGFRGPMPTVLLKNVCDETGKLVTDHLWFNLTKGFASLDLRGGEMIEFRARVKEYVKGYQGRREDVDVLLELDYKLSHPTKLHVITAGHASSHG